MQNCSNVFCPVAFVLCSAKQRWMFVYLVPAHRNPSWVKDQSEEECGRDALLAQGRVGMAKCEL